MVSLIFFEFHPYCVDYKLLGQISIISKWVGKQSTNFSCECYGLDIRPDHRGKGLDLWIWIRIEHGENRWQRCKSETTVDG